MAASVLLLDFGGVISKTPFETHRASERALGLAPGTLDWMGPFDPAGDRLWAAMQADAITERDYWAMRVASVAEALGETGWTVQTFLTRTRLTMPADEMLRPEALALVARVAAAGRRCAVLSNELELFYGPGWADDLPVMRHMAAVIDGTHTGILKPAPEAYRLALDALGVAAGDVVFVDDQKRNADGALAVGMKVVHLDVRDPAAGFAAAARLLGL
ncbi:MAG: HAD-IA family hydrolase [Gemmobacter sp.]